MNLRIITSATKRGIIFLTLVLMLLCVGCNKRTPKSGVQDWMPQNIGGPIEIKPLPPAQHVDSDYHQWLKSEKSAKVRLYEALLQGTTNQLNYTVQVQRGDTPLGATDTTFVTFIYRDKTNGEYQLSWHLRGHHRPDFLKLDDRPKKFLVQFIGPSEQGQFPRLQIMAIEGIEPWQALVAEVGQKSTDTK